MPARKSSTPNRAFKVADQIQRDLTELIARELKVSVDTVKDHVAAVLRALNVSTRTQAVLAVSQMTQAHPGLAAWRPSANR